MMWTQNQPNDKPGHRAQQRWLLGWLLVGMLGWSACFDPLSIIEQESIKLLINGMSEDTRVLRVELAVCEGQQIVGAAPRVFEHNVTASFGNERFYLPATLQGATVDLVIWGLSQKRESVQHLRVRMTLQAIAGLLPAVTLRPGPLQQGHRFCHTPAVSPPKDSDVEPVAVLPLFPQGTLSGGVAGIPSPWAPGNKPLPSSPSPDDLLDTVTPLAQPTASFPVWGMAAQGKWVAVINSANEVELVDINTGDAKSGARYVLRPDGCQPRAVDIQGDILAVVCSLGDVNRLMLFSMHEGAQEYPKNDDNKRFLFYGPREGFDVGRDPIAVKISGHLVVVLNQGSKDLSILRMDRMAQGAQTFPAKGKDRVWENPVAMALLHQDLYIADKDRSTLYHYRIDQQGDITLLDDKTKEYANKQPLQLTASGRYLLMTYVTKGKQEWGVQLWEQPQNTSDTQRPKTILLDAEPHGVALLSHTALVTHSQPSALTVVHLRTRTTQRMTLSHPAHHVVVSGERIMLASSQSKHLQILKFNNQRHDLIQWRAGSSPHRVMLAQDKAWVFDPLSRRLLQINQLKNTAQKKSPYVEASYPLPLADSHGWMAAHDKFLFFTGDQGTALYIRRLPPRPELAPRKLSFLSFPVQAGRVVGDKLYLLHWSTSPTGPPEPPRVTTIKLNVSHNDPDRLAFQTLRFPAEPKFYGVQPVDILPWSETQWVVADQRHNALYLMNARDLSLQHTLYSDQERPLAPLRLARLGNQLAVTLDTGKIMLVNMPSFERAGELFVPFDGSPLGALAVFEKFLLVSDRSNDIVMICDPARVRCSRVLVGCDPSSIAVVGNFADDARLITANSCDGSLSFVSLKAYLPSD